MALPNLTRILVGSYVHTTSLERVCPWLVVTGLAVFAQVFFTTLVNIFHLYHVPYNWIVVWRRTAEIGVKPS